MSNQAYATAAHSRAAIANALIIPAIQSRFVTGLFPFIETLYHTFA